MLVFASVTKNSSLVAQPFVALIMVPIFRFLVYVLGSKVFVLDGNWRQQHISKNAVLWLALT